MTKHDILKNSVQKCSICVARRTVVNAEKAKTQALLSLRFNFTVCHPGGSPQGDDRVQDRDDYRTTLRSSSVILRKSAISHIGLLGVPAHICAVGLYSGGNRLRIRLPLTSQNQASLRESCPQGVTIPNAKHLHA